MAGKILIVDADSEVRWTLKRLLVDSGYSVLEADDGIGARNILESEEVETAVIDYGIPDLFFLNQIKDAYRSNVSCIVMTVLEPGEIRSGFMKWREVEYLPKPFPPEMFVAAVNRIFKSKEQSETKNQELLECQKSIARNRVLFDDDPDQIFFLSLDGTIIDANRSGCSAAGINRSKLGKENIRDVKIKDLSKIGLRRFKKASKGERVNILLSYTEKRRGKQLRDIQLVRVDMDNSPMVLCRIRDLSQREKIEAEQH